ncbi:hypothetical protein ACI2KR_19995 [Pseudomonas luteola]
MIDVVMISMAAAKLKDSKVAWTLGQAFMNVSCRRLTGRGVMTSSIPGRLFAQEGFSKNKHRNDDETVSFELEHRVIGLVKQTRYTHRREEQAEAVQQPYLPLKDMLEPELGLLEDSALERKGGLATK